MSRHGRGLLLLASSWPWRNRKLAGIVTRDGDKLLDGGREYRFISFNIPNLHYVEDDLRFDQVSAWRFPDAFEVHDAIATIVQTGGRVARMYALSVRRPDRRSRAAPLRHGSRCLQ